MTSHVFTKTAKVCRSATWTCVSGQTRDAVSGGFEEADLAVPSVIIRREAIILYYIASAKY